MLLGDFKAGGKQVRWKKSRDEQVENIFNHFSKHHCYYYFLPAPAQLCERKTTLDTQISPGPPKSVAVHSSHKSRCRWAASDRSAVCFLFFSLVCLPFFSFFLFFLLVFLAFFFFSFGLFSFLFSFLLVFLAFFFFSFGLF